MIKALIRHGHTHGTHTALGNRQIENALTHRGVEDMEGARAVVGNEVESRGRAFDTDAIAVPDDPWSKLSALLLRHSLDEIKEAAVPGSVPSLEELFNFRVEPKLREPDPSVTSREITLDLRVGEVRLAAMGAAKKLITPPLPEEDIWIVGKEIMAAVCAIVGEERYQPGSPDTGLLGRKPSEASLLAGCGEVLLVTL